MLLYVEMKHELCKDPMFVRDVEWQDDRSLDRISETEFLCEAAWVVFNSGMRATTIRGLWPRLTKAFACFDAARICSDTEQVRQEALNVFGSIGKVNAVIKVADMLRAVGWDKFRVSIARGGVDYLDRLPYIGPVTKYHLAKNIGFDCVKPDRHIKRMADALETTPDGMCHAVARRTGDKVCVVDLVLWKWASTNQDYMEVLERRVLRPYIGA
jgi:hypothetical protein